MYYEFEGSKGGKYFIHIMSDAIRGGSVSEGDYRVNLYRFHYSYGEWFTSSSSLLPSDIDKAIEYSELLEKVIDELKRAINRQKALDSDCSCNELGSECPSCEVEG